MWCAFARLGFRVHRQRKGREGNATLAPRTKTYSANRGGRIMQVSSGQFIKVTPKVNNKLKDTQQ